MIKEISLQLSLTLLTIFILFFIPILIPIYKVIFTVILVVIFLLTLFYHFSKNKKLIKLTNGAQIFLFSVAIIVFLGYFLTEFLILIDTYGIERVLIDNMSAAQLIFFLICFSQPIILPIPEAVTIVGASAVFGSLTAASLGFLGTTLGIVVMFFIARIGGKRLVLKFIKEKHLHSYQEYMGKNETLILALMFLIPILPDEIICIGAGIGVVSFKRFLLIAAISKLVTSTLLAYSVFLAKVFSLTGSQIIFASSVIIVLLFLISSLLKRSLKHNRNQRESV